MFDCVSTLLDPKASRFTRRAVKPATGSLFSITLALASLHTTSTTRYNILLFCFMQRQKLYFASFYFLLTRFLLFPLRGLFLLALPSSLEPSYFTVESTLSSPCFRSGLLLSSQGTALAHLDSLPPHDLVLWTDGSVPFPFGKGGSDVLANCSLCGIKATLSFSAGPVCSCFSAEVCAILQAFCWSRQHQQVCQFSSAI